MGSKTKCVFEKRNFQMILLFVHNEYIDRTDYFTYLDAKLLEHR